MKRVTILDGISDDRNAAFEETFEQELLKRPDTLRPDIIRLRDRDIHFCTGCWTCWTRTPGICAHRDEMPDVLRSVLASDLTVFLSPLSMGFVSSLTKKTCDRLIPIVLPDFSICGDEFHHKPRYHHYPRLALVLIVPDKEDDQLEVAARMFRRMALNLQTELSLSIQVAGTPEEAAYAVSRL